MVAVLALPSCMTTRTPVGNYASAPGEPTVYSKGKQCYLFWGLLPLGRKNVEVPASKNCEVRTRVNFWDGLATTVTAGIFSMQSIRVYVKQDAANETSNAKADKKDAKKDAKADSKKDTKKDAKKDTKKK